MKRPPTDLEVLAEMRISNLRPVWTEAIKEAIWLLNRHRPGGEKDIFLFSNRRGGSTWLMEIIAANRGVKYIDQPFVISRATLPRTQYLPLTEGGQLVRLNPEQEEAAINYIHLLREGKLTVAAPWEFWRPGFDFVSNRLVLKMVSANALIGWFSDRFDAHIVYQTRHPIPTALSIMRNGWALTAYAFLTNVHFVEKYLDEATLSFCWDVMRSGSRLQRYVMEWALSNIAPLRQLPERSDWHYVSYEEALLRPDAVVDYLCQSLKLADRRRMRACIDKPSRSTRRLVSESIQAGEPGERLRLWRRHVDPGEERAAFEILDRLEISIYRYGDDLSTVSFL